LGGGLESQLFWKKGRGWEGSRRKGAIKELVPPVPESTYRAHARKDWEG